jgi:hypothetical protein
MEKTATVTVRFEERKGAERFATDWARLTKKGHTIGAGLENVDVVLHNVTTQELNWITRQIEN